MNYNQLTSDVVRDGENGLTQKFWKPHTEMIVSLNWTVPGLKIWSSWFQDCIVAVCKKCRLYQRSARSATMTKYIRMVHCPCQRSFGHFIIYVQHVQNKLKRKRNCYLWVWFLFLFLSIMLPPPILKDNNVKFIRLVKRKLFSLLFIAILCHSLLFAIHSDENWRWFSRHKDWPKHFISLGRH